MVDAKTTLTKGKVVTIERFTKQQFETALTKILSAKGNVIPFTSDFVYGEWEYYIPLPHNTVSLGIRSSIDRSGIAASTGDNSIRVRLLDTRNDKPLGSKIQAYVTRVPGWQERLGKVMRELARRRLTTGDCHKCGAPLYVCEVKKDTPNKGRLFAKCTDCGWWWGWLDKPEKKVYFRNETQVFP